MLKKLGLALVAFCLLHPKAKADTLNFAITLTPTSGMTSLGTGTGGFSLVLSPQQAANDAAGIPTLYGNVQNFSIQFPPATFTQYSASAYFYKGQVTNFIYNYLDARNIGGFGIIISLSIPNLSSFTYINQQGALSPITMQESGTVSVTAITPEPSSFALLGTGLLGVAGLVKRRLA